MTLKFVVKQKLHFNDVINVYHYDDVGGIGAQDAQAIADEIADAYRDELTIHYAAAWTMVGIDFYDTDNPPGTPAQPLVPAGGFPVGVATGEAMANQLAVMINWTCQQGPPFRGRTYLAGWTEQIMGSVGNIASVFQSAAQDFANRIRQIDVGGGNVALLVIRSGGTDTVAEGTTAVVTNGSVNGFPKTQRRRALGVGS